ncbi:MAG: DUF4843 domain-containing protein [Candidatus Pedobacter colombiensis]|uniref:DUF4843 domain-containing protein n=1 Tax=Candidatus Pedobacter colombiensis TaxID=3121371 RepID=A0AAJ6B6B4_9SPHI|nr:DUF4843 domain-containing protein [Pedobacter sp.]WEK18990.1 MAG: DUF4843 domain-containing protein [Pedobacter sp.]
MKKLLNIMLVMSAIIIASCKKETLITFDESISGNSIYFESPSLTTSTGKSFTFGYSGPGIQDTTLTFTVAVTGKPSDKDRTFSLAAQEGSTMTAGLNYDFVTESLSIPAKKVKTSVKIRLYRTPDILTQRKYLFLKLVPNDNFNTNLKNRVTTNKDTLSLLDYYVGVDDLVTPPYAWSVTPYKTNLDNYLGAYSKVKLQLLISLFEIDPIVFTDQKYAKDNYFSIPLLSYWGGFMKLWLAREAVAGRVHKDENGVEITMGIRAQ